MEQSGSECGEKEGWMKDIDMRMERDYAKWTTGMNPLAPEWGMDPLAPEWVPKNPSGPTHKAKRRTRPSRK